MDIIDSCKPLTSASHERRSLHRVRCEFIHQSRTSNRRSHQPPIMAQNVAALVRGLQKLIIIIPLSLALKIEPHNCTEIKLLGSKKQIVHDPHAQQIARSLWRLKVWCTQWQLLHVQEVP